MCKCICVQVLIAYSSSLLVLWNIKSKCCDKKYLHDPGINHVSTYAMHVHTLTLFMHVHVHVIILSTTCTSPSPCSPPPPPSPSPPPSLPLSPPPPPPSLQVLTSVSWLGSGKMFFSSYSDGTLAIWNPKVDNRPDKVFHVHGRLSTLTAPYTYTVYTILIQLYMYSVQCIYMYMYGTCCSCVRRV